MIKTKTILLEAALLISGVTAKADRLVIKGSDTLGAKLVPQLAEAQSEESRHYPLGEI